ncbi:LPS export ABC transporter periplasmic protein LptC [Marinomonas sp. IMCC 4694]|uniref:LPS export ABC transporter periplasmic protein LptC n=1 Tax=Marinomonas sp. IMCC 4694 TaxID=2605432 RepID=UPI0011E7C807|nr:LPS export ABC transporter periplasmic protein LptC [Marinomonas sp. IMCC 4694]TYL48065.1 LPS export ABC transporter periplasmic protein LptC [Marinomonas sp. IMCC 4694]
MPIHTKFFTIKALLVSGTTALVLSAVFWLGTSPKQNLVATDSLSTSPDYFITQVKITAYNTNGELVETLNAKQTLHYVAQSKTLLESPNIERFSETGYWNAKADKGIIDDGSSDILLTENAQAIKKYRLSENIQLVADNVHYLEQDQSLISYGNAMLISTQGETSAGKITTYIHSEDVLMTGSVRGKYETIR